jgi:type IV pilus assembly protein PilE
MMTRFHTSGSSMGFTLVELMVAILVMAIMASIAVPTYSNQIRKSRRTEARNAVLDAASREERFFATHNYYSVDAPDLGYAAYPAAVGNYYQLTATCTNKATPCTDFTITANPLGAQLKDTDCATLSVDQTGLQAATGSATAATTCWN